MTDDLTAVEGVGEKYADRLRSVGVESIDDLADVDVDAVAADVDVPSDRLAEWRDRAAERADGERATADESSDSANDETADESPDPADDETAGDSDDGSSAGSPGPLEVRDTVQTTAGAVIGRELDAIVEILPDDDGWRVQVEVVERPSVPNTQDIMGLYELTLDGSAAVKGYERVRRYRRSDTTVD